MVMTKVQRILAARLVAAFEDNRKKGMSYETFGNGRHRIYR
jgi:hypothetical protein